MVIVNFAHPLTDDQLAQIRRLADQAVERVIDVPVQFDGDIPFADQVRETVTRADVTPTEWQTLPLLVIPPSFAPIAAVLLAYLHGLIGHFPTVVRIRPVAGAMPTRFEAAEIIDLNTIRDAAARARRAERGAE